jgi:hypothetical protein
MKKQLVAALAALVLLAGCPAVQPVADIWDTYEANKSTLTERLASGQMSVEEFNAANKELDRQLMVDLRLWTEDMQERTATNMPSTGIAWLDLLIGVGGTVASSIYGTNVVRDRKRKKFGPTYVPGEKKE